MLKSGGYTGSCKGSEYQGMSLPLDTRYQLVIQNQNKMTL